VRKYYKIRILVFVITVSLLGSCSPRLNRSILTFFFDGVPSSDSIKPSIGTESKNDAYNSEIFRSTSVVENQDFIIHYPYKEKECLSCHDENSKSELIMPQPDLCYTCHDDFSKVYKKVHGPVSGGYCTSCHNAHMSKEKKLLIRKGQQLCFYCHESKAVFSNEVHKDIADSECILCHNPHGGEDRFILN
jgi:predicted CXXCH cytochrome family protein